MTYAIQRANPEIRVPIKWQHHAITVVIMIFVQVELDRAIYMELNDIWSFLVTAIIENTNSCKMYRVGI